MRFGRRHFGAALQGASKKGFLAFSNCGSRKDPAIVGVYRFGVEDMLIGGFVEVLTQFALLVSGPGG